MIFDSPFQFFFEYFWYGLTFHVAMYFLTKVFFGLGFIGHWGGDARP